MHGNGMGSFLEKPSQTSQFAPLLDFATLSRHIAHCHLSPLSTVSSKSVLTFSRALRCNVLGIAQTCTRLFH